MAFLKAGQIPPQKMAAALRRQFSFVRENLDNPIQFFNVFAAPFLPFQIPLERASDADDFCGNLQLPRPLCESARVFEASQIASRFDVGGRARCFFFRNPSVERQAAAMLDLPIKQSNGFGRGQIERAKNSVDLALEFGRYLRSNRRRFGALFN